MSTMEEREPSTAVGLPPDEELPEAPEPMVVIAGTPCRECTTPIRESYFLFNGHAVCFPCHERLQGSFQVSLGLGLGAALLSIALYYAIFVATGWRFVFIAVVAGLSVGAAVRKGAKTNMKLRYRWLAVVLTYLATAATYAHSILELQGMTEPVTALVHSLYLPVLMVTQQKNLVTLVLLGFGLHEGWKFSAPPRVHVEGPYRLSSPPPPKQATH